MGKGEMREGESRRHRLFNPRRTVSNVLMANNVHAATAFATLLSAFSFSPSLQAVRASQRSRLWHVRSVLRVNSVKYEKLPLSLKRVNPLC